jgi:hypothetical protein
MRKFAFSSLILASIFCLSSVAVGSKSVAQDTKGPAEEKLKETPVVTAERPMSFWMEKKLEYTKKLLEALTMSQYDEIESNSEQMRLLGKIEGFVRRRSPAYTAHLQSFDLATREMTRQARAKSIEGATLAFHQLTTSCVACHQTLREMPAESETVPLKK